MFAIIGFITIAVTYMISRGVPQPTAMAAVSVCGIVQFVASILAGVIDQKIGPRIELPEIVGKEDFVENNKIFRKVCGYQESQPGG